MCAQDDLNVHGVVSDAMTSGKLGDVTVTVKKDGAKFDTYVTRANGKYEFYLDCGANYELLFEKEGYVNRSIIINSNGVPEEVIGAGIIMPTDMSMYEITEAMDGADLSVFDKPIGKAAYDPSQADLVWDFGYTNQVKGEIFKFIRDIEKKQKELDKEQTEAEKADQELEQKFNEFVRKGDEAMSKDDYEDAVLNYQAALDLKPDDMQVQGKLGDAQTKWDQLKAQQKIDSDYSAALDAGDGFMRTEEFEKAIEKYQEALEIKPGESYPEEQIAEAERIIAEREAAMAKQEQFNALMAEADALVGEEKYEEAIPKYEEALAVIPGDREAESKLASAREALAALRDAEEKNAVYQELLASADKAFEAEDFSGAKDFYEQASDVFPNEEYPKTQIEACHVALETLASEAEKRAEFDALIVEGDEALTDALYETAVLKYTEALEIIPSDETAREKLKGAQALLDEQLAESQKRESYEALIAEADNAFDAEEFGPAKEKYSEAKQIIPEETYPTERISEIDRILAERAEGQAAREAYDNAMASGRAAMEGQSYAEAVTHFSDALEIKPEDKDAGKALEEARAALSNMEEMEARRAEYERIIGEADGLFDAAEWEESIGKYEEALAIYKDETYPQERIEEARQNIENEKAEAEAAALEAEFNQLVEAGDAALANQSFDEAISKYEEALNVKESPEVETKIAEAEAAKGEFLAQKGKEEQYAAAIAAADADFDAKNWDEAIQGYNDALGIKPDESYPAERISLIEETKAAEEAERLAAIQAEFDALIASGDEKLEANEFDGAVSDYEAALKVMESGDVEKKIEDALAAKEAYLAEKGLEEHYLAALTSADSKFDQEDWEAAIEEYRKAQEIKPKESYPADRIALIEETIAAEEAERQAALQEEFDALVANGDKKVEDKNFSGGITDYEAALELMESAQVEEKIELAKKAREEFEDEQARRTRYDEAVAKGDAAFDVSNWEDARIDYSEALSIYPDEAYPQERLDLIDQKIAEAEAAASAAELAEKNARVDALVAEGDAFYDNRDFPGAVGKYEEALGILPDREEVRKKLEDAEAALLARQEAEALDASYLEAIADADKAFDKESWEEAKGFYNEALGIKTDEVYPKQRIDEIDLKLEAIAEAERLEREAALKDDFDNFIAAGDKHFNKSKFDKALDEYRGALALLPDNQLAKDKVAAAEEALGELEADRKALEEYAAAIAEADELFKGDDLEMAKLKYADASEILPEEDYPRKRIQEIDIKLEKIRLAELAKEKDALDKAYQSAIDAGDGSFASRDYDAALASYEEALELKPEEAYPQSQIERIELKREEAENAKRERERLAALEEERRNAAEKRRSQMNLVNTDSEDQAERFMREAREAEQKERYERVKKIKVAHSDNLDSYAEASTEMREANLLQLEAYRKKFSDQYKEPIDLQQSKIGNSVKYKSALLGSETKRKELEQVRMEDEYEKILALEDDIARWKREMQSTQSKLIRQRRKVSEDQLDQIEEWQAMSYNEKISANEEIRAANEERYRESQRLKELRKQRADDIQNQNEEYGEFLADLNEQNLIKAKENKADIDSRYSNQLEESKNLARNRRDGNLENLQNKVGGTGLNPDDYYRSELAENYPQGVTEESSTLGNKVIIRRIVVKGRRGDEYKKVVDKAGEYYFKNGRSISEYTWNRETIEAFQKSKD